LPNITYNQCRECGIFTKHTSTDGSFVELGQVVNLSEDEQLIVMIKGEWQNSHFLCNKPNCENSGIK